MNFIEKIELPEVLELVAKPRYILKSVSSTGLIKNETGKKT
jgi:hypothetical protein